MALQRGRKEATQRAHKEATYLFKTNDADMAVFKAAAREAGVSFADWLRAAAWAQVEEDIVAVPAVVSSAPMPESEAVPPSRPTFGPRTEMCIHRVPATAFCKTCDC
jgi:hypothetical protein